MRTINIKGKEYVPVSERIKEFRSNPAYAGYRLECEIVRLTESMDEVIIKALIYDPSDAVVASGYAHEEKNSSMINKMSFIENCETSAVGRALAMLGIGIDASVASADELAGALERQEQLRKKVGKTEIAALRMACEEKGRDFDSLLSYYDCGTPEELNYGQFTDAMKILNKRR